MEYSSEGQKMARKYALTPAPPRPEAGNSRSERAPKTARRQGKDRAAARERPSGGKGHFVLTPRAILPHAKSDCSSRQSPFFSSQVLLSLIPSAIVPHTKRNCPSHQEQLSFTPRAILPHAGRNSSFHEGLFLFFCQFVIKRWAVFYNKMGTLL